MFAFVCLSILVNSYWMYLIVVQAYRAVKRLNDTDEFVKASKSAESITSSTDLEKAKVDLMRNKSYN